MCSKWLKHETKQSFSDPLEKKNKSSGSFLSQTESSVPDCATCVSFLTVDDEHKLPATAGKRRLIFFYTGTENKCQLAVSCSFLLRSNATFWPRHRRCVAI